MEMISLKQALKVKPNFFWGNDRYSHRDIFQDNLDALAQLPKNHPLVLIRSQLDLAKGLKR